MIKTINQVKEGDFKILPEMTLDFLNKTISVGVEFDGQIYACKATFTQALADYTPVQKVGIANFFKKVKRIAINNGVQPDTPVQDSEIEDLL